MEDGAGGMYVFGIMRKDGVGDGNLLYGVDEEVGENGDDTAGSNHDPLLNICQSLFTLT
jgi:hypothetical protein